MDNLDEETLSCFPEENSTWYRESVSIDYFLSYVKMLTVVNDKSLMFDNIDSKLYYKLRHNMLKTYALSALGLENLPEKPFNQFPDIEVNSKRTPDCLTKAGMFYVLIEFTVSNKFDTILKTKSNFSKYSYELSASKVPIRPYFVYLSLDGDIEDTMATLYRISSENGYPLSGSCKEELEDVLSTIKSVTSYLSDYAPEILSMNVDVYSPQIDVEIIEPDFVLFPTYENIEGKRSQRTQRVRMLLRSSMKSLGRSLRNKLSNIHYKIHINFVTRKAYFVENESGWLKSAIQDSLDMESMNLLDIVIVLGDLYTEAEMFKDREISILDINLDRPKRKSVKVDYDLYENSVSRALFKSDWETLTTCDLEVDSKKVLKTYYEGIESLKEGKNIIQYRKSPFIFPACSYIEKGPFDLDINTGEFFTDVMIRKAQGCDVPKAKLIARDIDYDALRKHEVETSKLYSKLKARYGSKFNIYNSSNHKQFTEMLKDDPDLQDMSDFRQLRSRLSGLVNEATRSTYKQRVRINLTKDGRWESEMGHFRKVKNVFHVVGPQDMGALKVDYRGFLEELFSAAPMPTTDDVHLSTDPLGVKLAGTCTEMKELIDEPTERFKSSYLGHSLQMISQTCYSLMYYSNIKLNKDDFVYDNLGNTETLLMVKGGPTIRKKKVSRFFRLLLPVTEAQAVIMASESNKFYLHKGRKYLLTPWRMLRIDYLRKGLDLYNNFGNFYATSSLESGLTVEEYNKFISLKVLLMFSQKRRLEVWISSLRYIYLNSLGTHSDVLSLVKTMPIMDTDTLIYFVQRSFADSYSRIFECAREKRLYDIVWEESTANFDLVAERFEENIFMTRAPFNPYAEHIKNLKGIFDTHKYYMDHVGSLDPIVGLQKTAVTVNDTYLETLDEFDFNFDPKVSYIVGDYCGKYISASMGKNELLETFNSLISRSYTEISSSKGMRRDTGVFWGSKGHDVVYEGIKIDLDKALSSFPEDPSSYGRLISESEVTFFDKISKLNDFELQFDVKDKKQFKDSREIFVMTENTKLLQNPLEAFFAKLCRQLPNELIHRPSNTRPKFIHSKLFEHTEQTGETMHLTMDCRKWAPRSNLWKYYYFVKGMAKFLPDSFVEYFFKVWTKMFTKRVRIQKGFIESLVANEAYSHIEEYLIKREDGDFELIMPYSFMMGIFNYLSSLMHAASQMYFSDNLAPTIGASCNFLAHSDDSAGIITARNYDKCLRTYDIYEKFQRTLNHLMSKKKCCLSKRSFEIISIMYCDRRFIPMTHKFLSNCSFDPKGGGWYDDVSSITGKVIDLYNNGGTHLQCYGMMLANGEILRKAYHLPRNPLGSSIPLPFGGTPNYHPIHMILVGSVSQECLLDLTEDRKTRRARIQAYIAVVGDYVIGNTEKLKYALPYVKAPKDLTRVNDNNRDLLSAVASLPYKNTFLSYAKHVNKLYDRKYIYSLTGFDADQLALATLFYPCSIVLPDSKQVHLSKFTMLYQTVYLTDAIDAKLELDYPIGNYLSYFRQVESIKVDLKSFTLESSRSCKPVIYNTVENFGLKISQENLMILSAIEKDSRLANIHESSNKFKFLKKYMMSSLPGSEEDKSRFLKNFDPSEKEDKVRSGYLFMPGNVKIDTVSRFFTYSMLYTTRRYTISRQKPQLFTPSEFSLESRGWEDQKHMYLLFKLLETQDKFTLDDCNRSRDSCETCSKMPGFKEDIKIFQEMLSQDEMREFPTNLPFVDYHKTQYRGKNVWYAGSDFTLYAPFGKVSSTVVEDNIWTTWEVEDTNYLQPLWGLYRMFCVSRNIDYERPSFQDTGFSLPKIAFNDFDTPYVPTVFSQAMVLPHSKVVIGSVEYPRVSRRGKKFYLSDRVVDFKIYSIYDISHTFYELHNLKTIKDYIYRTDLSIDEKVLISLFSESKIYQVLLKDPRHMSDSNNKYARNGFLGKPGSFTRALALADEAGLTRYRSSYNHVYINKGAIEFDTVEGVPVLDMFEKVNYARLNHFEKGSFEKAVAGYPLSSVDKNNLVNIRRKIGLEALGTALVLHKHVFENMLASSVIAIPKPILTDVLKAMIDAIQSCMKTLPDSNIPHQYLGSRKSWWGCVKKIVMESKDSHFMPQMIAKGLLRSKSDNPHKFWSMISDNVLLSSLTINHRYYANLVSMLRGIISALKGDYKLAFRSEEGVPKYKDFALSRFSFDMFVGPDDNVVDTNFSEGEPVILSEDALDGITGGDDLEDFEDGWVERVYDSSHVIKFGSDSEEEEDSDEKDEGSEDEAKSESSDKPKLPTMKMYNVMCSKDVAMAMQDTALNEFDKIIIRAPHEYVCFPWLGKGNYRLFTENGYTMYESEFPGVEDYQPFNYKKVFTSGTKAFTEIAKGAGEVVREPKVKYLPGMLKGIDDAREVLKSLNIFEPRLVSVILPEKLSFQKILDFYLDRHQMFFEGLMNVEVESRRRSKKFYLPGFQGILEDSKIVAEARAIFGENCYHIFSGNVKLTKNSYDYFLRVFKRLYRDAGMNDKPLLLFLISTLIDTTIEATSDQWYVEVLTKYANDIDLRLYPDDDYVMFPVAPTNIGGLEYREMDIFES
jgi:hypothetical protein